MVGTIVFLKDIYSRSLEPTNMSPDLANKKTVKLIKIEM